MPRYPAIATWPFVASLAGLIANDGWLKAAYPGWLTGKLSDVAGLAVVTLLLLSVPRRGRPSDHTLGLFRTAHATIYAAVVIAWLWWKSPWSEAIIAALNTVLPSPIGRTVDYSDLLALAVLPLCGPVAARPAAFALPGLQATEARRWLRLPLFAATAFALMADTCEGPGPRLRNAPIDTVVVRGQADRDLLDSADAVDRLADALATFLQTKGFVTGPGNASFGLLPYTGHARLIYLWFPDNDRIFAHINVSQCCVEITFVEVETERGSNTFSATPEQREKLRQLRPLIESFVRRELAKPDLGPVPRAPG